MGSQRRGSTRNGGITALVLRCGFPKAIPFGCVVPGLKYRGVELFVWDNWKVRCEEEFSHQRMKLGTKRNIRVLQGQGAV